MKKIVFLLALIAAFSACQQSRYTDAELLKNEIAALEKKLLETGDASKDKQTALLLIEKTKQFAKHNPQDPQTPVLLFKAADAARGAAEYGKAIYLWGQVWRNYGEHPQAPMALFLQGFTFDSDLRDAKMATQYYQDFLTHYPDDPLADQVTQLLAVVAVSPEDLVKQFEKQSPVEPENE